jgi:hypothetical protein
MAGVIGLVLSRGGGSEGNFLVVIEVTGEVLLLWVEDVDQEVAVLDADHFVENWVRSIL